MTTTTTTTATATSAASLCMATSTLAPYFFCGLIRAAEVDAQCMWEQTNYHSSPSPSSLPSSRSHHHHHHHHHHQQQQRSRPTHYTSLPSPLPPPPRVVPYALRPRPPSNTATVVVMEENDSNDTASSDTDTGSVGVDNALLLDEDRFLYTTHPLTAHCSHYVTITDSLCEASMVGYRVRVPGVVLLRFMDRLRCDEPTRRHLATHCGRAGTPSVSALMLGEVMETALSVHGWRAMEALFLPMPHDVGSGTTTLWLMDEASFVGRYAHCFHMANAMRGPVVTHDHRMYIVDETQRQRLMTMTRFEFEHASASSTSRALNAVFEDRDPAQRDALIALMGISSFQQDFNPHYDVRLSLAAATLSDVELTRAQQALGLRAAPVCTACQDNVAQVMALPCRHLSLCIACAIRTYNLRADYVLPTGMPRLMPTAKCTTCLQTARTCCRVFGVASR